MTGALENHLWQSTIFVLAAALLAIACRQNRAQVRFRMATSRLMTVSSQKDSGALQAPTKRMKGVNVIAYPGPKQKPVGA